mmetsp:Transcript_2698/g.5347  ORF Transcript_2698/g.5347 Transcript_2698/m.5347 type:complete len:213 (-) Transcript_2698:481-1119(-)
MMCFVPSSCRMALRKPALRMVLSSLFPSSRKSDNAWDDCPQIAGYSAPKACTTLVGAVDTSSNTGRFSAVCSSHGLERVSLHVLRNSKSAVVSSSPSPPPPLLVADVRSDTSFDDPRCFFPAVRRLETLFAASTSPALPVRRVVTVTGSARGGTPRSASSTSLPNFFSIASNSDTVGNTLSAFALRKPSCAAVFKATRRQRHLRYSDLALRE